MKNKKVGKLCVRNWHITLPSELETALKGYDCFCKKKKTETKQYMFNFLYP